MITYCPGEDMLREPRADVLVNAVNCVGAMGGGLAKSFRHAFPQMFTDYHLACKRNELRIGKMHVWHGDGQVIVNFPTKKHWRDLSKLEWVEDGLIDLAAIIRNKAVAAWTPQAMRMTRFWTSDLHIGHARIIELCNRPFKSLAHMETEIRRRWCSVVTDDDEVWVVGDAGMGQKERTIPWFSDLPGTKILVPGNHDACFRGGKRDWAAWLPEYRRAGFTIRDHEPGEFVSTTVGETEVAVCHFPTLFSVGYDKYAAWRPETSGWLVHGHTHQLQKRIGRNLHIGVDAWDYTPVPEEELVELIAAA